MPQRFCGLQIKSTTCMWTCLFGTNPSKNKNIFYNSSRENELQNVPLPLQLCAYQNSCKIFFSILFLHIVQEPFPSFWNVIAFANAEKLVISFLKLKLMSWTNWQLVNQSRWSLSLTPAMSFILTSAMKASSSSWTCSLTPLSLSRVSIWPWHRFLWSARPSTRRTSTTATWSSTRTPAEHRI